MATAMDKAKSLVGHMLRKVHPSKDQLASAQAPGLITIKMTSSTFEPGFAMPRETTQEGESISPQISWTGVPPTAKDLALICEDPDAPHPTPIVHWIVYGIPPKTTSLESGPPMSAENAVGAKPGKNYQGKTGYMGPMPPLGHGVHHYHFQLFALDLPLRFTETPTREQIVKSMEKHVIGMGELVGTYERKAED
jgi:hypothetical protein